MSKLRDLVSSLCPDGVEKKTLNEIGIFIRGAGIQKSELSERGFPAIHYGEIHTKYGISADTVFSHIESPKSGYRQVQQNDLIMVTTSEDIAGVGKPLAWLGAESPYVSGETYIFRHSQNAKYLAYLLQDKDFQIKKLTHITGTKVKRIHESAFTKIAFPIPPIEVQNEIVTILDKFRELEAELEAELDARKSQYEHYRNRLFSFEDGDVRWLPMGDICEMSWGNTSITKASYIDSKDGFLAYSASGPDGLLPHYEFDRDAVILSAIGARCGKTYFASGKWTCIKNTMYFFSRDAQVLDKYLFWYTNREEFWPRSTSAQPFISLGDVRNLEVPVPDLATQQKIVDAMDKLDTLISNISVGLPAEIAARRQQYEYYRTKLLSFKELTVA